MFNTKITTTMNRVYMQKVYTEEQIKAHFMN